MVVGVNSLVCSLPLLRSHSLLRQVTKHREIHTSQKVVPTIGCSKGMFLRLPKVLVHDFIPVSEQIQDI